MASKDKSMKKNDSLKKGDGYHEGIHNLLPIWRNFNETSWKIFESEYLVYEQRGGTVPMKDCIQERISKFMSNIFEIDVTKVKNKDLQNEMLSFFRQVCQA